MVDNCCAPGCTNKRGKKKGTSFYRIPKDVERRAKWISAIKRARSKQNKTERWDPPAVGFRLCSDHFISGRKMDNPLSPDFVPSIFNYVPYPEKRKRKMRLEVFNRRQKAKLQKIEQTKLSAKAIPPRASTDCPQDSNKDPPADQTPTTEPLKESTHEEPGNDVQPVLHEDDPATPPCSTETCGDVVLADRGFLVKESIQRCQAELKIPAFTRGKKQLDPVDLENTRCLASLRIHIERVIGVLRQKYTVLQSTVPISFTDIDRENDVTYLDKIVSICCALTNVSESRGALPVMGCIVN
ncbi:THAP domain-containing protein 11 [Anabarilius grahami]|uniref:THAP domain-containing protein 11 n=1 Tax=Anabarilius grahami TaxID=495550 RepID=A0A3N0YRF5_ANAGA|nr:THAP domain-containing protein 11 [Anabarilius grahami]